MDTRKLQHVGGTYTVSIPKEWVRAAGLDAGDEIGIHAHDGAVVVQPPESTVEARATTRANGYFSSASNGPRSMPRRSARSGFGARCATAGCQNS